jgi:hypothetical protein
LGEGGRRAVSMSDVTTDTLLVDAMEGGGIELIIADTPLQSAGALNKAHFPELAANLYSK